MPRVTPQQKRKIGRVMHEFKAGELNSSTGGKVRNPRQAIAIALSEAGASRKQRGKKSGARGTRPTRTVLMRKARQTGRPGRSKMNNAELQRALAGH